MTIDKIILTVDPTCVCREGFVNAEIISPKMDVGNTHLSKFS